MDTESDSERREKKRKKKKKKHKGIKSNAGREKKRGREINLLNPSSLEWEMGKKCKTNHTNQKVLPTLLRRKV